MKRTLFIFVVISMAVASIAEAQDIAKLRTMVNKGNTDAMVKLAQYYEMGYGVAIDSAAAIDLYQQAINSEKGPNPDAYALMAKYYVGSTFFTPNPDEAFRLCLRACELGSTFGLTALGYCYAQGIGTMVDPITAHKYYMKAAANNDPLGYYYLGWNYYWGELGMVRDTVDGLRCLREAAELGEGGACDLLARHYAANNNYKLFKKYLDKGLSFNGYLCRITEAETYSEGYRVERDEQKSLYMLQAIRQEFGNRDEILYFLAHLYAFAQDETVRNPQEALQLTLLNIELNHSARSTNMLANSYQHGHFTNVDLGKAFQTYLTSANKLDSEGGQYAIAKTYADRKEPIYAQPEDDMARLDTVLHYLTKAYSHRNIEAAVMLGDLYSNGLVDENGDSLLRIDNHKAVEYYHNAVSWGYHDMTFNLGKVYIKVGNRSKAEQLYHAAIAKSNTNGYFWMADSRRSMGDLKGELHWLGKGDSKNNALCQEALGKIYEHGYRRKVAHDYKKAASYYKKSATDESLYRLAMLYLDGKVGKQSDADVATGIAALTTAAYHGHTEAMYVLGTLYENGTHIEHNYDSAAYYYSRLAATGNADGLYKMGCLYEVGHGVRQNPMQCVQSYQAAADMEHADAMCNLGDLYREGKFVPRDRKMAFEYYTTASTNEKAPQRGYYNVGRSYLEGCGVEIDTATAVAYLRMACKKGASSAFANLGDLYFNGFGGEQHGFNDSALYYYQEGTTYDNSHCNLQVGIYHYEQQAYHKAVAYLLEAAKAGEPKAVYMMGVCEQQGLGVDVDAEDAYRLFEMAVALTSDEEVLGNAYLEMGNARLNGNGCDKDLTLAKQYFDSAATYDNLMAHYNRGLCLLNGYGCNANPQQALLCFECAGKLGLALAWTTLGDLCLEGKGTTKNPTMAVAYYEKAIKAGSIEALCSLGHCYETGTGVIMNSKKAFELYNEAAEKELTKGMMEVARCYTEGIYVKRDDAMALRWFTKAAEAGHEVAQYYVGMAYLGELCKNSGQKVDNKKAKAWIKQSAEKGYQPAVKALEKL